MRLRTLAWGLFLAVALALATIREWAPEVLTHAPSAEEQADDALAFIESRATLLAPVIEEEPAGWNRHFSAGFIEDFRNEVGVPDADALIALYTLALDTRDTSTRFLSILALQRWAPPKLIGTALTETVAALPVHLAALLEDARRDEGLPLPPVTRRPGLYISELLASNPGQAGKGPAYDWIEIHNSFDHDIDLGGWFLSDDPTIPDQWALPPMTIKANGYLRVWASGLDRGDIDDELHTNFRLRARGEFLGLFDDAGRLTAATAFYPVFPAQRAGVSYGVVAGDGRPRFFTEPTPGAPNYLEDAVLGIAAPPEFSHRSGYQSRRLRLNLSSDVPGAQIYYTTDGAAPELETSTAYETPITIASNTIVRAIAMVNGYLPSDETSGTYLFLDDVLTQDRPEDWPESWSEGYPAHYTMHSSIVESPLYRDRLVRGLKALPILSIALPLDSLFHETKGIYVNPLEGGREQERAARIEFIPPDSESSGFVTNGGLRIQGGSSRQPETTPKHSFRVVFRAQYGSAALNADIFEEPGPTSYNTLVFRATNNHSWLFPRSDQREKAQYIRDLWAKDTQRAMGHPAPRCRYAHLYLNGVYWGLYVISERPDDAFMASLFGGDPGDYDVRKAAETQGGDERAWRNLFALARAIAANPDRYANIPELLDIDNFIDYIILNHYAGNDNWDFGNWYAARPRDGSHGFRFFAWDAENIFKRLGDNKIFILHRDRGTELFHALRQVPEFQQRFSERVSLHLTGEGVLTPEAAAARFMERAAQIDDAIVAESARWGTYRRDVFPYRTPPFEAYTRDQHWLREQDWLLNTYFPQRTEIVLQQYGNAGLYSPEVSPDSP